MDRRSKVKSQAALESLASTLLSQQEHNQLQELLGRRCVSLSTTVAQLLMAPPHSPGSWSLQHTGVVCFVKDNPQRSYFLRFFDIKAGQQLWEQEVFEQMTYHRTQPFFHTFAGDECQVGLNFADLQEAESFYNTVNEKISQRRIRQERGALPPTPAQNDRGLPRLPNQNATIDIQNPDILASRYRSMPAPQTPGTIKGKKDKEKKSKSKKGSKLSKADIGAPSGFTHVSHVGMDPSNLDPDLMKLLNSAGISEADLKDEETAQLVYGVIEQAGGIDAVKQEVYHGPAPVPTPTSGRLGPLPPIPGGSPSSAPAPPPPRIRSSPLPPIPGGGSQRGGLVPPPSRGSLPPVPPVSGHRQSLPPPPPSSPHPSPQHHSRPSLPTASHPGPPPPPMSHPAPPPPMPHGSPSRPLQPTPPSVSHPPVPPSHLQPAIPPTPLQPNRGGPAPPPPPPPPPAPAPAPVQTFVPSSGGGPCPPPPPRCGGGGGGNGGDGGGRGALLDQIRLGKKLKTVSNDNGLAPPPVNPAGGEGIVGALMMVMQKRSKAIHSSDEGEDEDVEDDDFDEWDD